MAANKVNMSFENADGYLICQVKGEWVRSAIFQRIADIAIEAKNRDYSCVLVDTSFLSPPPTELDRFLVGEQMAKEWKNLKVAVFGLAEYINKFTETAAINRGANLIVVSDMNEALDWLTDNPKTI